MKQRLDQLLLELGYFDSRQKAQTCIMMNGVKIAGKIINKAGQQINTKTFYEALEVDSSYVEVEDKMMPYVSRGAYKLKAAHEAFALRLEGITMLDMGASTGGFTDYALQNGAKQVYAVDVGKGQLHYKLQNDERVHNLEQTHINDFDLSKCDPIDLVVGDLSFISLTKIFPKLREIVKSGASDNLQIALLLKPQFEAGKEIMDKCKGVITDDQIRNQVIDNLLKAFAEDGFELINKVPSPIKGAKGNVEYLASFTVKPN